jgi:hypothetical protein
MKQFQYSKPGSDFAMGPYDRDEAENFVFALSEWLDTAAVGDTATDTDGDIWTRLPDVKSADEVLRDERLERIATAALQGLLAAPMAVNDKPRNAVAYAKALIAELDKQA